MRPRTTKFKAGKPKHGKKRPSPLPKLIGSLLPCSGGSFAPDLIEARLYRAPVTVIHAVTRDGQTVDSHVSGLGPEPAMLRSPAIATQPGNYRCQVAGTNVAGTSTVTSAPVAIFKAGKLKRNLEKGTAKLTVILPPEQGPLKLTAKGFKPVAKEAAGATRVRIAAKGAKKAKLAAKGKLKTIVKLTYTPPDGDPATLRTRVTLKQR
jgi:hypothetical protein